MGQAKLRGTFDERQSKAVAIQEEAMSRRVAERNERERLEEIRKAEIWAKMTPEQREAELEKAKAMATLYGNLSDTMGVKTALAMVEIFNRSKA